MSGAVLENFASHFHYVPFSSELYRSSFRALASTIVRLRLQTLARASSCPPRVKRLVTLPFNYKLNRISDYLLISEE